MNASAFRAERGKYQVRRGKKYWAELAANTRAQAEAALTAANKEVLLRISEAYERLAASAAKRENDQKDPDDRAR